MALSGEALRAVGRAAGDYSAGNELKTFLGGYTASNLSTNLSTGATTTTCRTKLNTLLASMRYRGHIA